MQTAHLDWDEATGGVALRMLDDLVPIGPLEGCDDDCPSPLLGELEELRAMVRDALAHGEACAATAAEADRMRHDPRRW